MNLNLFGINSIDKFIYYTTAGLKPLFGYSHCCLKVFEDLVCDKPGGSR